MKNLVSISIILMFSFCSFAQKFSAGINMGVSYDRLEFEKDLSLNNQVNSLTANAKPGFHIGIHGLIKVANRVKVSPQLLLAFSEYSINYDLGNDMEATRIIENVYIRIPVDLHLEILKGKTALYLFSGAEYAYNVADEENRGGLLEIKKGFFSGRLGIGVRKDFKHFSMSPEFTFVKSFGDIKQDRVLALNQVITNLDSSIVGFNLKFEGLLSGG